MIAVHELGGVGRPLLFVHATGFHGFVWAPLAVDLVDRYRCCAVDLRGHGDSPVPDDAEFAWTELGDDVRAAVAAMGDDAPVGVGHSSGATALLLAEQACPGLFRALYLYEPVIVAADPPLGPDPGNWIAQATRRRRATFGSKAEALASLRTKAAFAAVAPAALTAYVEHGFADTPDGQVRLRCAPEHEALMYEQATAHAAFGRLGAVRCPVLLARGGRSDVVGARSVAEISAQLPQVAQTVVEGLGHLGPMENPALVAASISAFVDDLGV